MIMKLALLLLVATASVHADEADAHLAAHLGVSYAINTFAYGLGHKALRLDTFPAIVFANATTALAGYLYKYMEGMRDGRMPANTNQSLGQDLLGIVASDMTVLEFNF